MTIFNNFGITINVNIPALDRLMDFLEAQQQAEVDALTAKVKQQLTGKLSTSQQALQGAINLEQEK